MTFEDLTGRFHTLLAPVLSKFRRIGGSPEGAVLCGNKAVPFDFAYLGGVVGRF